MQGKEVDLIDYFRILWKRKWTVLLGTFLCVVLVAVLSILFKPVFEIDTIIQTGKFLAENQAGNFEEVVVEEPNQIADKVNLKSYNALIAAQLNVNEKDLPKVNGEDVRNTLLVRMWIKDSDIELSKKVLSSLIAHLKEDIDDKIDIEINNIDTSINNQEIEKGRRLKQIEILKNKLKIIEQRKRDISKEMGSVRAKIDELEKAQLKVLKKENLGETESLGLLLYSTEIQQSLRTYDILNEKLSNEKLREEDINSDLELENSTIEKIENTIANLKDRKGRMDRTKIIKEPTSSVRPVWPRKKMNVLIAFIFGIIVFSLLVLFLEYLGK